MIGIVGKPRRDGQSSFGALIAYCEKNEHGAPRGAYTGMQNIHFRESAAAEMASLAFMNPRCKDPLMHIILSWREMELPTNGQVDEAVKITLKEFDLQDCQAVWTVHADTENRHVHIAANRIDPETYKAIQPAGRWTHKAIQRAARKIELAQGWSLETHGTYSVTADGAIIEKGAPESGAPKLSKAALDAEASAATKSAERICQETAAGIIREAKSWKELHERLADQGIGFERKGSGAVLTVGEIIVKASKAGRDISLSKLEARLGRFQPRDAQVTVREREAEPIRRVSDRKVKSDWERYTETREKYFGKKKEANAALYERQKAERIELRDRQREERGKLFSQSWKGKGALLNRQRSVMAASLQSEKLNLRDRHSREREELKKLFPARFFNFKTWLEAEASPESSISFRYPASGSVTGSIMDGKPHEPRDIRDFTPSIWNKGGVAYRAEGEREAQFIDYGKKIVLSEKCNESAILAALQLASQKWGGAEINGTDEYKRQCVELAVRHGLKLSNPDLAEEVEEGRKHMTQRQQGTGKTETQDKKEIFSKHAALREAAEKTRPEAGSRKNVSLNLTGNPNSAYWAHYRDIAAKFAGAMDYSRVDSMIGIRMKATGYTQGEVAGAIGDNAAAMRRESMTHEAFAAKYGNRDWRRYADETASKYVFGARGTVQYNKALDYRPYYMRLEGRGMAEEHRTEREQAGKEPQKSAGR